LPPYERETISLVSTDSESAKGRMGCYSGPLWPLRADIEKVRTVTDLKKRLIEATRLADSNRLVPRQAMVEMIAGAYQSSVCHHFGSMSNLVLAALEELGKA